MNDFREQLLNDREQKDLELFEKIKNNPRPDTLDLWALSEKRFIEWRRLNDFPVLLAHFDKVLLLFKEWKQANNLSNEIIIKSGKITPFLENKKLANKDKVLYLTKQTWNGNERLVVSYGRLEGENSDFGTVYKYELIQEFIPYLDWLNLKGKRQEILAITSRHAPNHVMERVFIHADVYAPKSDFELLRMGGIPIPVNGFRLLFRGKGLEFVNLCGLSLEGEIHFGELGNLSCSYCACDNWTAVNLDMPLLDFEHCTIENFSLTNSKLQQWRFYDCQVSGDFLNSKLYSVTIFGGNFNPIMLDCVLDNSNIKTDKNIEDRNFSAYKNFKKIYQSQGDDEIAKEYHIRENEFIRSKLSGWDFLTKSLSYYYWEYGRKPHRIIYLSLSIIIFFGFVYWLNSDLISFNTANAKQLSFGDSFYFSTITFTTLGYGDLSPKGWLKILVSVEAFLGVLNMGFLVAGYSNNKY